jgi:cytochrome c553
MALPLTWLLMLLQGLLLSLALSVLMTLLLSTAAYATENLKSAEHSPRTAHQVPNTIAQRVQACTGCHGKEGRATNAGYFPRIAGKPAGYLFNQLLNFRDQRRYNPAMNALIENLSDAYLREIAEYFAALDLPYPAAQSKDSPRSELERGEALIRRGDPARNIPACVQCHGDQLTGVLPAVPGLLGLSKDYLIAQLGSWQTGQRHAGPPDCMAKIANLLRPEDVGVLTTWLSSQNLPKLTQAAPALKPGQVAALAMPCGSGFK